MLSAGVVGLGRIGCGFMRDPKRGLHSTHVGSYSIVEGIKVVAVCDTDAAAREQARPYLDPDTVLFENLGEMLTGVKLDVLSVCTPVEWHLECVTASAAAGVKVIFCEKPLASTVLDGEIMVKVCEAESVLLSINHQRRFSLLHQKVSRRVRSGAMGRVQGAHAIYTAGILNSGSHLIDLLRLYLGDVSWVRATYSTSPSWRGEDDPNIDGTLHFRDGYMARVLGLDSRAYSIFSLDIFGTTGAMTTTNSGFGVKWFRAKESPNFVDYKELVPGRLPVNGVRESRELIPAGIQNIVDVLENDGKLLSTGEDGLAALEIIEALKMSARKGVAVSVSD